MENGKLKKRGLKVECLLFFIFNFLFLIFNSAQAVETSVLQFLNIPASPVAQSLGGGNASFESPQDLLMNPALLCKRSRPEISAGFTSWIEDITLQNFSAACPVGQGLSLGVFLLRAGYGSIAGYDYKDEPTGNVDTGANLYSLGAGYDFGRFKAGCSFAEISQKLSSENKGDITAMSFGASFRFLIFEIGISRFSPSGKIDYGPGSAPQQAPEITRTGINFKIYKFLLTGGKTSPAPGEPYTTAGIVFSPVEGLKLRAGMNTIDSIIGYSAGAGLAFENISVDYAFGNADFGNKIHNVSIGVKFGHSALKNFLLREAKRLYSTGYYEKAQEKLNDVLILDPENRKAKALMLKITGILSHIEP